MMDTEAILKALERYDGTFPREALRQAIEQKDAVTPHLLEGLRFARAHARELPEGYCLTTWAAFLLAQFRETRAYPLLADLLELPRDLLERLLDDCLTEDMSRILASVCGGDTSLIEQLAENPEADEYVRDAALGALVSLVATGQRSREETLSYFGRLFRAARAEPGSFFWGGLVMRACDLYPDVVREEIKQAFDRQLVGTDFISMWDVQRTLARGRDATLGRLAREHHYWMVEDTIRETEWWYCFQAAPSTPRPPAVTPAVRALPLGMPPPPGTAWAEEPAVQAANVGPKTGRNARCPCGSGFKFKNCCLRRGGA